MASRNVRKLVSKKRVWTRWYTTGVDFADFLLGTPSIYSQGFTPAFYQRSKYLGAYAQDSWRTTPNLTLNYGVRWDVIQPWYEKHNQTGTLIPGEQSVVFPTAPTGFVFPGDPGVPQTIAPTRYKTSRLVWASPIHLHGKAGLLES